MDVRAFLSDAMRTRILLLDGPKGTLIQSEDLGEAEFRGDRFRSSPRPLKGDNDLLCLTRPSLVASIHRRHLAAGSDIIETNTFNANRISQADFGMEEWTAEMNEAAARIARAEADAWTRRDPARPRLVAGSLGPTGKAASISPRVEDPGFRAVGFDELEEAYLEQALALARGGAELFIIETVFDTLNGKAALAACEEAARASGRDIPVMVSGTIVDASGRNLSGQTVGAFLASMWRPSLLSIGLNCSLGARAMKGFVAELAALAPCPTSAHPNAGLPNELGGYDESPEAMAAAVEEYCAEGLVNVVGGCCGSRPEHIEAIGRAASRHSPRTAPRRSFSTVLSGLEPLRIEAGGDLVDVGERCNVAGSRKFARMIREGRYRDALAVAREMVEAGAQVIDVCMDDALIDARAAMADFVNLLGSDPEIARCPLMIDSSSWPVVMEGLKRAQGKCVVNSISLKEGEAAFLAKAREAARFGAAAVVMLFDERGQADTYGRKIEIASRAHRLLVESGFPPEDILFDPNILAVGTGIPEHDLYARDFIRACAWIRAAFPHSRISGGVSNLSFAFRGVDEVREALHSVFLYHAHRAGMDLAIVNPGALPVYDEVEPELRELAEDLVLFRRPDASERLLALAERRREAAAGAGGGATPGAGPGPAEPRGGSPAWRDAPPEERLAHALVKGIEDYVAADVEELAPSYPSALALIEGPLMSAMSKVGELFSEGRMFLPQVIKSARAMKRAVAQLEPRLRAERSAAGGAAAGGSAARGAGRILLATVKGDVHDIGKSIVGVVLACNGFEVVDLGVMVPREEIVEAARREGADLVAVSGLIAPSLEEMRDVARALGEAGLELPLMVGGATTSAAHTALKIAPGYSGPVVHARDASAAAGIARALLSPDRRDAFVASVRAEQARIRGAWEAGSGRSRLVPVDEARKRRAREDWADAAIAEPSLTGALAFEDFPLRELVPYVDWSFLLLAWDVPGRYPEVLEDPIRGPEARRLVEDGRALLAELIERGGLKASGAIGIWPANSRGDDVVVWSDRGRKSELARFSFLRSQVPDAEGICPCLADFVAPEGSGRIDYLGAFAVTAGLGAEEAAAAYRKAGDDYRAILVATLADRLAEAFAERLHEEVGRLYWRREDGAGTETAGGSAGGSGRFRGIRPAPGYPACPVHSDKATILRLLGAGAPRGMGLTGNWMLTPAASVCGFYFAGGKARYFDVGPIGADQRSDWLSRCGLDPEEAERALASAPRSPL